MWISMYTFLEIRLFLSASIYDTTQNFFTILTVWTKIVHTANGEDNHCPHCYRCGQNVKNVEKPTDPPFFQFRGTKFFSISGNEKTTIQWLSAWRQCWFTGIETWGRFSVWCCQIVCPKSEKANSIRKRYFQWERNRPKFGQSNIQEVIQIDFI